MTPYNATNKQVTWSSGDTSVATVDNNGLVTVVGEGMAIITATTVDGNHKAYCVVNGPSRDEVQVTDPEVIDAIKEERQKVPNEPEIEQQHLIVKEESSVIPGTTDEDDDDEKPGKPDTLPVEEPLTDEPPSATGKLRHLAEKKDIDDSAPDAIAANVSSELPGSQSGRVFEMSLSAEPIPLPVEQDKLHVYMLIIFLILFLGSEQKILRICKGVRSKMIEIILTPLKEAMHVISSGLLVPTIIILLLFLAWLVVELGGLLVEIFTERRRSKINVPKMIDDFQGKDVEEILEVIRQSCLFRRQKTTLGELISYSNLPSASLQALARRLIAKEELHYVRITNRTDLVVRLGPMFGLIGTLIPLGPGIIALGQGNTKVLADSLLTAFDTTVTGLIAAGVAFVISRLRKRWYEDYLSVMEALIESLLEVFARERGIKKQKA